MTTIQGYPALIVVLVLMLCVYVLGRTRGYRKAVKKYGQHNVAAPSVSQGLNHNDLVLIEGVVKDTLSEALGYDPDYDTGIDDSNNGLAQQLCAVGADWTNNIQNTLQLVKCEIISEIIDRIASDNAKLQDHIVQEIKAQDRRAIKRESMRAARAKDKIGTEAIETIGIGTIEAGIVEHEKEGAIS